MPGSSAPTNLASEDAAPGVLPPPPGVWAALLPFATLVATFVGMLQFGEGAAPSAELVLTALVVAAGVAIAQALRRGASWSELQAIAADKLAAIFPILLILLSIGVLIGTWIVGGTIPMLIRIGLTVVDPQHFVITAFGATALMSLCTGTSWGSAGTIGVALMGVAQALGAPVAATAGAIVSGAYFGDKLSPLSDSTNIAALGARAPLDRHIKALLQTSLPATLIAVLVYWWVDSHASLAQHGTASSVLLDDIERSFSGSAWSGLPVLFVLSGIIFRWPPCPTMLGGSAVAMALGMLEHGISLQDVGRAAISGFRIDMLVSAGTLDAVQAAALGPLTRTLLERGGMWSMATPIPIIMTAFLLTAGLERSGALASLLSRLRGIVHTSFGVVVATLCAGVMMISVTSHGGVSSLVVGEVFQPMYTRFRLAPENLSRCLEESITVIDPLLPWTVSGVFMAGTLGVATTDYLGWAVFAWVSPILSIALAGFDRVFGRGLIRIREVNSP